MMRPTALMVLLLILETPCRAEQAIEGAWTGQAGTLDNRATVGLEITAGNSGELTARFFLDLIGIYGQPLGIVKNVESNHFTIPDADMELHVSADTLTATGFLHDPKATIDLHRSQRSPRAPLRAVNPAGASPIWTTRLGGAIFAEASIRDGIAYLGNVDGVFSAITVADGNRVWSFAAGRAIYGEALATDTGVYFVCDNGFLFRLDRASGKEVWRYDLGDALVSRTPPNPFVFDYEYQASRPLLVEGVLYVGSADGSLHAVRADVGRRVWRIESKGKIRSTVAISGSKLIFSTQDGLVEALDWKTGKRLWQFDAKSPVTTSVAIVGGRVMVGARDSMLYALDPADGRVIWNQYWWGSWIESTAVEYEGLAYIGSGDLDRVSCIDPVTGQNRWRTDVGGWVFHRPAVTPSAVYVGVSGARRSSSIWLPQASALIALDRLTGRVLWQWSMPELSGAFLHGFVAAPVIAGDTLLIGGVDGTLYAFPAGVAVL